MVHLGNATTWQFARMWDRFYALQDPDLAMKKIFVDNATRLGLADNISTAGLQMLFLNNKDDPYGAIRALDVLAAGRTGQMKFEEESAQSQIIRSQP